MMINLSQHPVSTMPPEERDFLGLMELDEAEPPLSREDAFSLIEGRVFQVMWPDDDFPW
jgi:hypothetical protein